MNEFEVRPHRSSELLPRTEQLAWKIAEVAGDPVPLDDDVVEMILNRIIDNAAVSIASLNRPSVAHARDQALCHRMTPGATVFGISPRQRFSPEWAAWANGVAVRELDYHDTFLAQEYAHPADSIPALTAVAQHRNSSGPSLISAIATAYEIQVSLATGMCLHSHKIDHIAHVGPSIAAGIGSLLHLPIGTVYEAIQQALHTTTTTRQSRKGEISSWKAYAPAFAGKMAIESADRAMRDESSPSPIYEGEDGFIAWMLDGPEAKYRISLPGRGESKRAILNTYTKEYAAEYQSQAFIDLAKRIRSRISLSEVDRIEIYTSHHTHSVIGTGSNDPQKFDPAASRETLDHSLMYVLAVALEDGDWHHDRSYQPNRAKRPSTVSLWRKISTIEDPSWTARYHSSSPSERAFGGRMVVYLQDGSQLEDRIDVADAHPNGNRPFHREDYVRKFRGLSSEIIDHVEQDRFLRFVERLPSIKEGGLGALTVVSTLESLDQPSSRGLF